MRSALLAATILLGLAAPARATLQIAADINGTAFQCIDNAACDGNAAVGTITLSNQNFAGVQVDGSIQTSTGTPANPNTLDILNASSLSLINTTAGTIVALVTVSDTSFTAPVSSISLSASGTWENAIGSSVALTWHADVANAQGADTAGDAPGVLLDTFTSNALLKADSLSHNATIPFSAIAPFSMSETALITLTAGGTLLNRGQTMLAAVETPEPASLALLGVGLIGLAMARRRIAP